MRRLFDPIFDVPARPATFQRFPLSLAFVASLTFPSNIASIDLDFVNDQYFSTSTGISSALLPDASNSDDGRLYRQQIVSTQPNFLEKSDGSLKTYGVTSSIRRSNLLGSYIGIDFTNVVIQNRSFNNAAWTVVGGTAAKNGTGRTGVANSCSTITLTATTCTVTATAAVTSAAADRIGALEWKASASGSLTISLDNGATTPAQTTKSINGAGALGFKKTRFNAVQSALANPQMKITLTGAIGEVFTLDFAEGIDGGTNASDVALYEQPPIATTTASVKVWRDRPAAAIAGYTGTTITSPAATFMRSAVQVHYFEYWQRRDGSLIASAGGIQISSNQTAGVTCFGLQSGAGNLPNYTTDLRSPVKNKVMVGASASDAFICLNGTMVTGVGGSQANTSDHFDLGTNGAADLRNCGGVFRHIMSTDYSHAKAAAVQLTT